MNILFIIPALVGGGAERVTVTLARALKEKYNVRIVTYYREDEEYYFDNQIEVICLNISNGKNAIEKIRNSVKRISRLKKIKKEYAVDCTISMLATPNFENVMSRYHDRVVVSIRNKCSMQVKGIHALINSISCKLADKTVALSKNVMYDQITYFGTPQEKITTIYNPCDIETIKMQSQCEIDDQSFMEIRENTEYLVITAGRLIEQKGQWHLVRAFSDVVRKHPSAKLVIMGRGEMEEYLRKLIQELHLENSVYLLGFHSNPYPYLAKADVFAFTSLFEGFGNILLEAMCCGLAIVSTDCDAGPRELLAPSTDTHSFSKNVDYEQYGVLTPIMDGVKYTATDKLTKQELLFSKALCTLFENPKLLKIYREKSAKRIEDFCLDSISEQWIKLIEN